MAPPAARPKKATPAPIRYYLVVFNVVSLLGWAYLLVTLLAHLLALSPSASTPPLRTQTTASSALARLLQTIPLPFLTAAKTFDARLPPAVRPFYRRATTAYAAVGTQTAAVQTLAVLEVVHVLLGWVKSSLPTTAAQVASRLFLVWGIVEQFALVRSSPIYTTMLLSWCLTEVIRYSFYVLSLLERPSPLLLWLRYTTFYVLYPTGASSEALLIYAALPSSSPIPGWRSWIDGMWTVTDYGRGALFLIWWPGLYVLYTHMMVQRRKVLAKGTTLASKGPKTN
ncbi:hypothetical protein H0H87_009762 [Tephrocybe sp. NHM501043]|nr:hypothetical protein H0H87_009762 [Tephrocybe sp. NHM501043]